MIRMHKLIIGVRPATRMFRMSAIGGVAIDGVLRIRDKGLLSKDYYTQVTTGIDAHGFQLSNSENGNVLKLDRDNLIFIKDHFDSEKAIDVKSAVQEFMLIWNEANKAIQMRDIRCIGIAAEHMIKADHPTTQLLTKVTKIEAPGHSAKFLLKYEDRRPTKEALAPDIEKDDFINVLVDLYDSENDADHPEKGFMNANIDVQRYFLPLLNQLSEADISRHIKIFETEHRVFESRLEALGLTTRAK